MRQVGKAQHDGIAFGVEAGDVTIEFERCGRQSGEFRPFLASASAVFFWPMRAPISLETRLRLRLELFDLSQSFAPLFVEGEHLGNFRIVPCPTGRQALADPVGFLAY